MIQKLKNKKQLIKQIDEYYNNKVGVEKNQMAVKGNCYKEHGFDYWHLCHTIAEEKLFQLKKDIRDELRFLKKVQKILNKHHSQIPMIEIGRQNVLNDIDNELNLDKRIEELKEVLKDD